MIKAKNRAHGKHLFFKVTRHNFLSWISGFFSCKIRHAILSVFFRKFDSLKLAVNRTFLMLLTSYFVFSHPLYCYQNYGYSYMSPLPNARYVAPQTPLLLRLRHESPRKICNLGSCITVCGSVSGNHLCSISIASDDQTIICKPSIAFSPGEKVTVKINPEFEHRLESGTTSFKYAFYISESVTNSEILLDIEADAADRSTVVRMNETQSVGFSKILPNNISIPSNFPDFDITISDNADIRPLFLSTMGKENFVMILDNKGYPLWYNYMRYPCYDFKLQHNALFTLFVQKEEGYLSRDGFLGIDASFTKVDSFFAGDGYNTDFHELQLLKSGNYLLLGLRDEKINLAEYFPGGYTDAIVRESVIQEFTKNHEPIFLWRARDYFDIDDMEVEYFNLPSIRFPHINAIDIDEDGHILVSSRHLGEITKINRQTGDIIWRLGGRHNQFIFVNDPLNGFSGQHDIRALGNGRYTLFDNGNLRQPPISRAVEYELDIEKKTATLVWEFRDTPDKYSSWMGNVQRMNNGNTLINWAQQKLAKPAEVNAEGKKVYEMEFKDPVTCYRIFRFDWQGVAQKPYLLAEHNDDNITLLFNKFGDSDVDYYKIYAGNRPNPTSVLDTSRMSLKKLYEFDNRQMVYFRVTAVNGKGDESQFSNEESVFVNFITPGENMVLNSGFSQSAEYWNFEVRGNALSTCKVNNGQFQFDIQKGGEEFNSIQLHQENLKLVKGRNYLLEFDAYANENRIIEAYMTKQGDPGVNYGRIGPTLLGAKIHHFAYPFTMFSPSDYRAIIVFNAGLSNADVFIDNVSLKQIVDTAVTNLHRPVTDFHLYSNYPNPFNRETRITYYLAKPSTVDLTIYNINGQLIRSLIEKVQQQGANCVDWDGKDQFGFAESSGIYFFKLTIENGTKQFVAIKKMTLLK